MALPGTTRPAQPPSPSPRSPWSQLSPSPSPAAPHQTWPCAVAGVVLSVVRRPGAQGFGAQGLVYRIVGKGEWFYFTCPKTHGGTNPRIKMLFQAPNSFRFLRGLTCSEFLKGSNAGFLECRSPVGGCRLQATLPLRSAGRKDFWVLRDFCVFMQCLLPFFYGFAGPKWQVSVS